MDGVENAPLIIGMIVGLLAIIAVAIIKIQRDITAIRENLQEK